MFRSNIALILVTTFAVTGVLYWLFPPVYALAWLAVAFVVAVCLNAWFLGRLYRWAATPTAVDVPTAPWLWGRVFDRIARFVRGEADARRALSQDAAAARAIVDRLPDALVLLGQHDQVAWHNEAARAVFGFLGTRRPIQQFVRAPEFAAYLRSGDFERPLAISLPSRPGRTHEVLLHVLEDGGRLLICRDITAQASLNQMRSDFVANVSHEIRTPITVIGGFAETMLDLQLGKAQQQEYLNNIVRQSQTMQRLVADLLTLSSLENAPDDITEEIVEVGPLMNQLITEAQALSANSHSISLHTTDGLGLFVRVPEIESAVRNLLSNAVRYTPAGGQITLSCRRRNSDYWIAVEDNGPGIAAEHLPRLTERFYRVDSARSRATGGTGLGLAIVKRIANRHGGTLHVTSHVGLGSCFSLILPASRVRALPDSAPPKQSVAA